jgi:hypothetical protein
MSIFIFRFLFVSVRSPRTASSVLSSTQQGLAKRLPGSAAKVILVDPEDVLPIRCQNYLAFAATILIGVAAPQLSRGQAQPSQPAKKPPSNPVGPPAPQSTHYPILLLAFGDDPSWSLRIGLKGPERLDRPNYPPIPLDPAEVTHETAADSWTYHAKDAVTGAAVAVHLTREPCAEAATDPTAAPRPSTGKYTFTATVDHTQLGSMKGCARIAAELFPKINNQIDDSDDASKNKPPPPTITNFKPPAAVAYLNQAGGVVLSHGTVKKIAAPAGMDLSLSHDGKKLLFTRSDSKTGPDRTLVLYDFDTGKSQELVRGLVRQPFWSPDDSRIAFLKAQDHAWQVWSFPAAMPETAALFSPQSVNSLHGWTDGRTVLASDTQNAYWLSEDKPLQTIDLKDIYGPAFQIMSSDTLRLHPLNSDLLVVSADFVSAPAAAPKDAMGLAAGFFLYELKSKRRTVLLPQDQWGRAAEWSRDGFQVFYTRLLTGASSTFRIFWDGTGVQKFAPGTSLVVGR